MKNFKKVLALTLALAVIMSSMTVAFAASANDAKAKVLYDLGLFKGTSTTEFKADLDVAADAQTAIVLIGRALKWPVDMAKTTTFKDDATWAEPYIAYAVEKGITNGVSATEFGVKVVDGKRMVTWFLRALGYNSADAWTKNAELAATAKLTVPTATTRDAVVGLIYEGLMAVPTAAGSKSLITTIVGSDAALLKVAQDAGLIAKALAVDSVTATNLKEIFVTFNQAPDKDSAETKTNYTLSTGGPVVSATLNGSVVTLKVTSDALAQQTSVDVTVKDVKDAAGVKLAEVKKNVVLVDTTLPTATAVKVTGPKTIEVTFSEPLKTVPTFKIDNGTYYASPTFATGDKKIVLTFGVELSAGDHTLNIKDGTDFAGYKVTETSLAYTYAKDTVVPTVTVDKVTETKVTLVFSKAVKATNLNTDVTAYYAYNEDAQYKGSLAADSPDANGYATKYVATFTTPIPAGTHMFYLNTKADKLEDTWGVDVASQSLSITAVIDNVKPVVSKVEMDGDKKIKVTFSEDVQAADAQNKDYYVLKDSTGAVVKNAAYADVTDSGKFNANASIAYADKVATITLTTPIPGGSYSLMIEKVRDAAYVKNTMDVATFALVVTDKTAPTLSSAIISADAKKVRLTFSEAMGTAGLTTASNYRLVANNAASVALPDNSTVTVINTKTVEISLGSVVANFDGAAAADFVQANGSLVDVAGNAVGGFFGQVVVGTDSIAVKGTDSEKATAKNTITFKLDKELKAIDVTKITYNIGAADVTVANAYYVNGSGEATVTVVLPANLPTDIATLVNVKLAADAVTNVFDTKNAPITIVKADIDDKVSPEITKVETKTTTSLEVTFSEAINASTVSIYTFTVADNTVNAIGWVGNVLTLTLKDAINTGAKPVVTQALNLADSAGNVKASGSAVESTVDKVAAVATGDFTNADTKIVVVSFSEAMDSATLVQANFSSVAGGAITAFVKAADNKSVTITFTTGLVNPNSVVVAPAVLDAAGNASGATIVKP